MKLKMLLFLALGVLLTFGLNAQADLSETFTSSTGLTFDHPEGYTVSEQGGGDSLAIQQDDSESGFLLAVGAAATENVVGDVETTEGVFVALGESFEEQTGEPFNEDDQTVLEINDEDAYFQFFEVEGNDTALLVFATPDGELAIFIGLLLDREAIEEDNLMIRMAETVRREEAPEPDEDPDQDGGGEVRPLTVNEMPEGFIIIYTESGYSEFAYPDTVAPFDADVEIQTTVVLQYVDNLFALITVTDLGANSFFDLELIKESFVGVIAESAGDNDFDTEDSFEEVELADGRTAEYYEFEGDLAAFVYLIQLDDDRFGIVQSLGSVANLPDTLEDDLYQIASSFMVSDFTPGDVEAPDEDEDSAEVEFDGETVTLNPDDFDVQDLECGVVGFNVVDENNEEALVTCPAGCGDGAVWGTDIYTSDSSICTAAIHAGAITTEGGLVLIRLEDGQESYEGSERNGVSTRNWGSWNASFSIFRVIEEE
ncbi:MAG: LCCL domain-containing protein [Anaerolineae bacterium]|jgi:hypothetical protein|nr:LCCL domain-containing protein [Anaerolineae bacterium]